MASNEQRKVPRRIAQTLINALKGGVVPRVGLPYITVGRRREIEALLSDVDMIAEGGASFRFIMGRYGSGKSFLLQTLRSYVMAKNFVVVDADLSPERRLQGTRGQGLATYRELIRPRRRPRGAHSPSFSIAGSVACSRRRRRKRRRTVRTSRRRWSGVLLR